MAKLVARQAETVLPIVRVTMNGPTRLMPLARSVSAAQTWLRLEAPPLPATSPVRGCETSAGDRPDCAIACCIDR
jgi:hypothetical protein